MSRSKKIFKLIAAKRPELVLCQDRLVVVPTGDILRGFILETTTEKDMVYLWRVIMPLYQPRRGEYLDYSNRIGDGEKIYVNRKAYRESAEVIDAIIAPHIPVLKEIFHARDFLKHVDWMIGNDSVRFLFDLALTYYRIGDVDQATSILATLPREIERFYEAYGSPMGDLMKKGGDPLEDSMKQAARQIAFDPIRFAALLDEWERRNIETLGLQATRLPSAQSSH
jgi:hypothetical protein